MEKNSEKNRVSTSIEYLNLIYQQNIQQKETRDKWFRYYLLLIVTPMGLIATISQTNILSNDIKAFYLFLTLSSLFFFILGFIFLTIYIKQRQNYIKSNILIKKIEENIILPYIWNNDKITEKYSTKYKSKRTADYFANLVYIFLNSVWVSILYVSFTFYLDYPDKDITITIIGVLIVILLSFVLQMLYRFYLLRDEI